MANNKITVEIPSRSKAGTKYIAVSRERYKKLEQYEAEIDDVMGKIRRGNKAIREGKLRKIRSVEELM